MIEITTSDGDGSRGCWGGVPTAAVDAAELLAISWRSNATSERKRVSRIGNRCVKPDAQGRVGLFMRLGLASNDALSQKAACTGCLLRSP